MIQFNGILVRSLATLQEIHNHFNTVYAMLAAVPLRCQELAEIGT
jgi:hypothetical protein